MFGHAMRLRGTAWSVVHGSFTHLRSTWLHQTPAHPSSYRPRAAPVPAASAQRQEPGQVFYLCVPLEMPVGRLFSAMSLSVNYPRFTLGRALTAEQRAFFDKHGFLHFRPFVSPDYVQQILKATQDVQAKWLAEGVGKVNGVPIKYGQDVDGSRIVQRFAFASQHHPVLHDLLQNERFRALFPLLEAEGGRVGENEKDGLVVNHYVNVEGSEFSQMGWHTDALRDVFYGKRIGPMLNVGLHLDRNTATNGGLRVIPGTHRQGLHKMLFRKKYYKDVFYDPDEVAIETEAGDLTVHDGRMWHRVARSPLTGEASRRRVMYVPIIAGKYQPKSEASPTPFYLRFLHLVK